MIKKLRNKDFVQQKDAQSHKNCGIKMKASKGMRHIILKTAE